MIQCSAMRLLMSDVLYCILQYEEVKRMKLKMIKKGQSSNDPVQCNASFNE